MMYWTLEELKEAEEYYNSIRWEYDYAFMRDIYELDD